ncbi:MAG: glutamate--tRNA ligase [Actinomycetota bacterium]|nr:glutamate--tRNA ligase [Actinomycetota bacterium]MDQ6947167.1 glutamate--tRNA ligase [Actinomycetota bacterium]
MGSVRVRFAPSPTGYFHVGSARSALFNWLYARQHGGIMVLRIEDTDAERNRPEHIEGIQRAMRWLGLDWDEGPFFQSQRDARYQAAIEKLLADGVAYACDCTPEAVAARARQRGGPPGYDGFCRDRGLEPTLGQVIRFRTPDEGVTVVQDLIRGRPEFAHSTIEDFAIRKSSGQPLFILANVVDDADMAITHVIRGEEHLTNTAKYELLWSAIGYGAYPVFAHLPLLVNEKRQKLSKRRDKVALEQYRAEGYLPEAMANYLALLGWSPGDDREVLTRDELIAEFQLEAVKSAPAFFDEKKLSAVNAEYIRAQSGADFVAGAQAWLAERWAPLAGLVQERARTLADVFAMTGFLFLPEPPLDAAAWDKGVRHQAAFRALIAGALEAYAECGWDAATLKDVTTAVGERAGVPQLGKAQAPIRLAVTGRSVGPPLFESLVALGQEATLARLRAALARLDQESPRG